MPEAFGYVTSYRQKKYGHLNKHRLSATNNLLTSPNDVASAPWIAIGSPTLANNQANGPDGSVLTASSITFNAINEGVRQSGPTCAGLSFQFSVWLQSSAATQLVNQTIQNNGGAEISTITRSVTTAWQQFVMIFSFSAVATGVAQVRLRGTSGNTVYVWGATLTIV